MAYSFLKGKLPFILLGLGSFTIISISFGGFIIVPKYVENEIKKQTQLTEGSMVFDKWVEIPIPIYQKFHFFNVTNGHEFNSNPNVKPFLQDIGPFVYRVYRKKEIFEINEDEDTIRYKEHEIFIFQRNMSIMDDSAVLTIFNMPFISASTTASQIPALGNIFVEFLSSFGENFVHSGSVKNFLFDGIDAEIYRIIFQLAQMEIPLQFSKNGKFSFYGYISNVRKLGFHPEIDSNELAKIVSWNGNELLDFYSGNLEYDKWCDDLEMTKFCNQINGSDGTINAPFVKKDTILYAFKSDICRSIGLSYEKNIKHGGISGYRFVPQKNLFEPASIEPSNLCFCPTYGKGQLKDNFCSYRGLQPVYKCYSGAPIILSWPHFFKSEPQIQSEFEGLNPNQELHEIFVELEPNSGIIFRGVARFQINIELHELPNIQKFKGRKSLPLPIVWSSQEAELDGDLGELLKNKLINPLKIIEVVKWTILGLGSGLVGISIYLLIFKK